MKPAIPRSTISSVSPGLVVGFSAGHDDDEVSVDSVADEGLRAVQHPAAVGAGRGRPDAAQVAAGAWFGNRDRRDQLPGSHAGYPPPELLSGGQLGWSCAQGGRPESVEQWSTWG
jgi:hypothetical protein